MVRLFNHWLSTRKAVFFIAEYTALVLALLAGASVTPLAHSPAAAIRHDLGAAFLRAAPAALTFAGALYLGDLYDLNAALRDRSDGRRLLQSLGAAMMVLAIAYLVLPWCGVIWISRRYLVIAAAGGALAVIAVRAAMPAVLGSPVRVLFLGSGRRARELARRVEASADGLFRTVGFVAAGVTHRVALAASGERQVARPTPSPVAAETAAAIAMPALQGRIEELAMRLKAQAVVVAVDDLRSALPVEGLLSCRTRGIPVLSDFTFAEATLKRLPLELVRPSALVFDNGFQASPSTHILKRALDLGVSLTLLVLAAPVMGAVALAIALADGRPIFYSQERTGRGGVPYRVWKFRTMRRDAETAGAVWATQGDPRVLRVGWFLRRTRLDELPQLWNVARGEMSLVGPRPERPVFVAELKARYPLFALRELVKPGLTGWAQLNYAYASSMEEQARKLEYDLYYIKNMSLFLDLVCLFHTARVILRGKGAR